MGWWSWKNWFLTVSIFRRYGDFKRTDFEQFLYCIWACCGGLEITDFEQFVYSEGVVVLKELIFFYIGKVWWSWEVILISFYIGNWVWWSWKNWFLTVCLERIWDIGRVWLVLKELILNSFYFGKIWWSWKNWFLTVSIFGSYGGLDRTDFEQSLYWEGVVAWKELIFNSVPFGQMWWSWKNWF